MMMDVVKLEQEKDEINVCDTQETELNLKQCQHADGCKCVNASNQLSSLEQDLERLKNELVAANKTKESIVMKYAKSENEVLRYKRELEHLDHQLKSCGKESEILNKKNKTLSSERERLTLIIDNKVQDINSLTKLCGKLRQDVSTKEFQLEWSNKKYSDELEAHKITKAKLDNAMKEHFQSALISNKRDSDDHYVRQFHSDSETEEFPYRRYKAIGKQPPSNSNGHELVIFQDRNKLLKEENAMLVAKVQKLEVECKEVNKKLIQLQESNAQQLQQVATLHSELAATEDLKVKLERSQYVVDDLVTQNESYKQENCDIATEMELWKNREAELLAYTQQATERNVSLQSLCTSLEAKAVNLEKENAELKIQVEHLQSQSLVIETIASKKQKCFLEEKAVLEADLNRHRKDNSSLQKQLDEAKGEITVLHKRLNLSVKELNKELKKNLVKDSQSSGDGMSQSSRASSNTSLNTMEQLSIQKIQDKEKESDVPVMPDPQVLVERIVMLQKNLAKKQEKMDIMKENIEQLSDAVSRKTQIIQKYAMSQDVDALSTELSENNKIRAMKHGGIMASVYGSKPADNALTLELSLEINKKLQLVLEDALLKNITLKENLNTLGKEISKLSEQNKDLTQKLPVNDDTAEEGSAKK